MPSKVSGRLNFAIRIIGLFMAFSFLFVGSSFAQTKNRKSSQQTNKLPEIFESKEPGAEFSIRLPPKWIAEPGAQRYAVILKPSDQAERIKLPGGLIADPSITVAVAKKPVNFSPESLEKTAQEIEENFIRYNGKGTDFQIFQKNILNDLPGGKTAFLYYVSYKTDGTEAGQAILISGNEQVRFRVTLSDHRLNFDRNLELYYPYMLSLTFTGAQIKTSTPSGHSTTELIRWGLMVVVAGVILGLIVRLRRSRDGTTIETGDGSDDRTSNSEFSDDRNMSIAPLSAVRSHSSVDSEAGYAQSRGSTASDRSGDSPEDSMAPNSMFGLSRAPSEGEFSSDDEAVFTEKDLSTPPQSIPLSQVVDENSAPPEMKKRWQISTKPKN